MAPVKTGETISRSGAILSLTLAFIPASGDLSGQFVRSGGGDA